jgi:hypothetical protein
MSMFGFGKKDDPFPPGPGKKPENGGEGDEEKDPRKPTTTRIVIWVVVGGIGLYLIGSGIIGILTH